MIKFSYGKKHLIIHNKRERITAQMSDNSIDLVLEDPPFGVRMEEWDNKEYYIRQVQGWLASGLRITKHAVIWFYASRMARYVFRAIEKIDPNENLHIRYHSWRKPLGSQYAGASNNNMFYTFEPIIIISKDWNITNKYGNNMPFGIDDFTYRTISHKEFGHPTTKPVPLIRKLMGHYSQKDEVIFDGFGGSFSMAVAAVDMGRRSMTVEQSPLPNKSITDYLGNNPDYFSKGKIRLENKINEPLLFIGEQEQDIVMELNTFDMFKE